MEKPVVNQVGKKFEFYWKDAKIRVLVSRIRDNRDRVTAELLFKTDATPATPHIRFTQLNLLSSRSRKQLMQELNAIYPADWNSILEQLCVYTLERSRQGEPVKEIEPQDGIEEPSFLVKPFIYEGQSNLFYGEGATGKSSLALALAILTQLPYKDNPLNLEVKKANVLYLDYETDEMEIKRRLNQLTKGFGFGELSTISIKYRQCILPLTDEIDALEEIVLQNNIDFIIIDSLGVAAGSGSLNEAQTATSFYSAIRRLKITSLSISHLAKDQNRHPTPFGSVYWTNICRNVWMIRKQQEVGDNVINIGLFHQKNNLGKLSPPIGFQFNFEKDKTTIQTQDVRIIPEFFDHLSLKARIVELLKHEHKLSARQMAEMLQVSQNHIRVVLNRDKSLFVRVEDKWGLKVQ